MALEPLEAMVFKSTAQVGDLGYAGLCTNSLDCAQWTIDYQPSAVVEQLSVNS